MNKQMTGGGHGEPSKIDRSIIIVAASPRQTKAVGSASLGDVAARGSLLDYMYLLRSTY
jgi:hypothetical protein